MAKHQTIRGAKIEQRNGSYTVRLFDYKDEAGKIHIKRFSSTDKNELIVKAAEWLKKKDGYKPSQITVSQAIAEYIGTCELAGHSPQTIVGYKRMLKNAYAPILSVKLSHLTAVDVQRCVKAYAANHAPKSVANAYGLLHITLKTYRPDLDLSTVRLPSAKNKASISDTTVIPSKEDIKALLAGAMNDTPLFLAILLGSHLGLRRSQICALTWQDIDLANRTLTINKATVKAYDRSFQIKAPKSRESRRTLPLPEAVASILSAFAAPSGVVVEATPDAITRRFQRLRDHLGITGRFHDLRAYHASTLVALQAPPEYIMADMGHSTMDLYRRVYTHMQTEPKTEMYEALRQKSNSDLADFFGQTSVKQNVNNLTDDVSKDIHKVSKEEHESPAIPSKKPDT